MVYFIWYIKCKVLYIIIRLNEKEKLSIEIENESRNEARQEIIINKSCALVTDGPSSGSKLSSSQ